MKEKKEGGGDRDETRARVSRSLYRRFKHHAWRQDIFVQDALEEALEDWMKKPENKPAPKPEGET